MTIVELFFDSSVSFILAGRLPSAWPFLHGTPGRVRGSFGVSITGENAFDFLLNVVDVYNVFPKRLLR